MEGRDGREGRQLRKGSDGEEAKAGRMGKLEREKEERKCICIWPHFLDSTISMQFSCGLDVLVWSGKLS